MHEFREKIDAFVKAAKEFDFRRYPYALRYPLITIDEELGVERTGDGEEFKLITFSGEIERGTLKGTSAGWVLEGLEREAERAAEIGAKIVEFESTLSKCSTAACGGRLIATRERSRVFYNEVLDREWRRRPQHRKKRILKKRMNKWLVEKWKPLHMAFAMAYASQKPDYVCQRCKRQESFWSTIASNLIEVQAMPAPAMCFFVSEKKGE